jgi:hypothetical protein
MNVKFIWFTLMVGVATSFQVHCADEKSSQLEQFEAYIAGLQSDDFDTRELSAKGLFNLVNQDSKEHAFWEKRLDNLRQRLSKDTDLLKLIDKCSPIKDELTIDLRGRSIDFVLVRRSLPSGGEALYYVSKIAQNEFLKAGNADPSDQEMKRSLDRMCNDLLEICRSKFATGIVVSAPNILEWNAVSKSHKQITTRNPVVCKDEDGWSLYELPHDNAQEPKDCYSDYRVVLRIAKSFKATDK